MQVTILRQLILFPNINEGINRKISLWLCCAPQDPTASYGMERFTLVRQHLTLLGFFSICSIILPIIDR